MPKIYGYDEIQHLPKNWIHVSRALPPIGVEVVVYCPKEKEMGRSPVTALCRYIKYEGAVDFFWDNNYPGRGNCHLEKSVTMWQPMPDEPKA